MYDDEEVMLISFIINLLLSLLLGIVLFFM